MEKTEEIKIPESVHNHLNYIRNSDDKIRFLELFFNIKLRWYQKLYLKYLLFHSKEYKQLPRFFQWMKVSSEGKFYKNN